MATDVCRNSANPGLAGLVRETPTAAIKDET